VDLVTAAEMREMDRRTIEEIGIAGIVLMENAGLALLEEAGRMLGSVAGKRVSILVGPGNNGGDGLVLARHLAGAGAGVRVYCVTPPEKLRNEARTNYEIVKKLGLETSGLDDGLGSMGNDVEASDLVVDAMLGTGIQGELRSPFPEVIGVINDCNRPVLAVDIPSGLNADTGTYSPVCIRASVTVTLALPKIGLFIDPGLEMVGKLVVADIGIPPQVKQACHRTGYLPTPEIIRSLIPARRPGAHKGDFGHVFILGGSPGMEGAVCLAAKAAARCGAGLVTAGVPGPVSDTVTASVVEAMTLPLPATGDGYLDADAVEKVLGFAARSSVMAIGPGMGRSEQTGELLLEIVKNLDEGLPVILDADGLNLVASYPGLLEAIRNDPGRSWVFTPHPGEMSRLLNLPVAEIQASRLEYARMAAGEWNVTIVLKGAGTIISFPGGGVSVNPTGNAGMATGGTGDVLTGCIASLCAQGVPAREAAVAGVYLHGVAGDLAAEKLGEPGMIAGDLVDHLPGAVRFCLEYEGGEYGRSRQLLPYRSC